MIQFKDKAQMERFFGVPEDSLIEASGPLVYAPKSPLPRMNQEQKVGRPAPQELDAPPTTAPNPLKNWSE